MNHIPWIQTVPSTIDWLLKDLDDDSLATLRATAYDDLIDHHFGLGLVIRNRCHLHDNPTLVEATGTTHADDASLRLLQALWRRICH